MGGKSIEKIMLRVLHLSVIFQKTLSVFKYMRYTETCISKDVNVHAQHYYVILPTN